MIYCTLLNPAVDYLYTIEQFVPGASLLDVPCRRYPAGKGINVANIVQALGEEVCVVGVMPERDRERFTVYLESKGIRHGFLQMPGDARTNMTIVEQKNGCSSHLSSAGPVWPPRIQDEFLQFAAERLKGGDVWCCSGSLPPAFEDEVYALLIKLCKGAGAPCFLDARGRPLRLGVRAKPMAVKPNSMELEDLFGEQIRGVRHIALKGKKLLDRGVSYVFISLGSDGMIAIHDNDCLLCVPPQVKTVDTVGCGDALMGGLLVAWARKFSFSEMCRLAIACGSSKAMHEGPHEISREEVWQLMEDVKITAV
ncbi:MAG: 1-phosphofructokinase family hexose kinase [Chitinispirillaceae bacterium]|nr:1-phosphofructokinase family hexose kinase [Chitinispirillaceae bacterium]